MSDYERQRLFTVRQLNLLDTPPQESFDRIVRTASRHFGLPVAAISLVDEDRLWLKSRVGIELRELPRYKACCSEVSAKSDVVVIPDMLASSEYADGALAASGLRFYAGAPLTTRDGYTLGSLCVIGSEPRETSQAEIETLRDLAGMVMTQIELHHAAGRIDPITDLANYNQLLEDLADIRFDGDSDPRQVLHIELFDADEASSIQRVMGPSYLDALAREAAQALTDALGDDAAVYHLGTCQFAHVLRGSRADALAHGERLTGELRGLTVGGASPFMLRPAIGVATLESEADKPPDVLRMAQSAVRDARLAERPASLYSPDADAVHQRSFSLIGRFREALSRSDALHLVYQPRVDSASGEVIGVEALLRWHDPTLGEVSPSEFVPLVERTHVATELTDWVLHHAIDQAAHWWRAGRRLRVAVNIAATNLEETDFCDRVVAHLRDAGLPVAALELELTESSLMGSGPTADAQLRELIDAGVTIAIDDFGTGYSSLAYLQNLPAQVVKIDRAFLDAIEDRRGQQTLVRSMIGMARELGYRVVAEGIETAAAWRFVTAQGCQEGQGYYLGNPRAPEAFEAHRGAGATAQARQ